MEPQILNFPFYPKLLKKLLLALLLLFLLLLETQTSFQTYFPVNFMKFFETTSFLELLRVFTSF